MEKEDLINHLIKRLAEANQLRENAETRLSQQKDYDLPAAINAAMVADVCHQIFGDNANGSPALMSHTHCGFVCGIGGLKPKPLSFVRGIYRNREIFLDERTSKDVDEWEKFLEKFELAWVYIKETNIET